MREDWKTATSTQRMAQHTFRPKPGEQKLLLPEDVAFVTVVAHGELQARLWYTAWYDTGGAPCEKLVQVPVWVVQEYDPIPWNARNPVTWLGHVQLKAMHYHVYVERRAT